MRNKIDVTAVTRELRVKIPANVPHGDDPRWDADGADREHEPEEHPNLGTRQEIREERHHAHDHTRESEAWNWIAFPVRDDMIEGTNAKRQQQDSTEK